MIKRMNAYNHDCLACGASLGYSRAPRYAYLYGRRLGIQWILRCEICGLAQVDVLPSCDAVQNHYARGEMEDILFGLSDEEISHHASPERIDPILRYIAEKAELAREAELGFLDVGAGNGRLINSVRTHTSWRCYAIEPNPTKVQTMARFGIDAIQGEIEDKYSSFPAGGISVVTMNQVLEHLWSPRAAIQKVRSLLAPNGVLWVDVPNCTEAYFRTRMSDGAPHLTFWTHESLEQFGRQEGFDVLVKGSFDEPIPLRTGIHQRLRRRLRHSSLWLMPYELLRVAKGLESLVRPRPATTCERVLPPDQIGRVSEVSLFEDDWTRRKLFVLFSRTS